MAAPQSTERATRLNGKHTTLGVCVLLVLAVLLVFGQTVQYQFLNYDDDQYFSANPRVQAGLTWSGLTWAFQTMYAANWHPLTWLSLMLDAKLFGTGPAGPHLTNVLLHAANTVLLFLLLTRLTGALWRSALVAGLFGLHPLHVESVAWISERKDVLSALFGFLTLLMYARYVEKSGVHNPKSRVFYGLALLFFALGLMSKPMLVTLPIVLLLLDYWPLGRTRWAKLAPGMNVETSLNQLLKEKLPFVALAAVVCVVTCLAQRGGDTVVPLANLPPGMRIANSLLSYMRYLSKAFWPRGLAVFYPMPVTLPAAAAVGAGIGLLGLTAAAIWRAPREPWLATGWFWYLGTLVPVIGLVQVGGQSMADRYTYLPFIGLFIMLCWSVPRSVLDRGTFKIITCLAAGAALAVCAVRARIQAGYWKDSETLFRNALSVTQDNWLAHYNLGIALQRAGKYEDAVGQYGQVIRLKPNYPGAHYNLAVALTQLGRAREAMEHWEQALRIKPDYAEVYYNLGIASTRAGKPDDAIGQYEQALRIKPDYVDANYSLGLLLAARGRFADAIEHFQKALEINPAFAEAHNSFGNVLVQQGRPMEAIQHFQKAVEIKPDAPDTHNNLGNALADQGRYPEAIAHYRRALQIKPDFAEAHYNLGNALAMQGQYPEAIEHFQRALQIKPDDAQARRSLDAALALLNQLTNGTGNRPNP